MPTPQPNNPMVGYKDGTFYRGGKPMSASQRMDRYSEFDEAMLMREQRDIGKRVRGVAEGYFESGDKDKAVSEIDSLKSRYPNQSRYLDLYGNQIWGERGNDSNYRDFSLQEEQGIGRNYTLKRVRKRVAARKERNV